MPSGPTLDESLVEQFHEQGYVVLEDALSSDQVQGLLAAIDRTRDRLERSAHRKDVFGLDVRPIITEDDAFLDLMECPATFPLVVRMLNHYNLQLMTSHLIAVPPNPEKRNIGWHTDGGQPALTGFAPMHSLKVGYFLTEVTEPDVGNLMVVRGSHRDPSLGHVPDGRRDPEGAVQITCRAGSAVFFSNRMFHAGGPNLSNCTRVVLYYGYGYRWLRPIDYDRMPDALMARCSPIGRQLLGAKATHLGHHVPKAEDCPLKAQFAQWFGETWMR